MIIHSQIQQTDYSDEWKQEANELLYCSIHSGNILTLLDNPDVCKRYGERGHRSNCFGTAFWVMGVSKYKLPEYRLPEIINTFEVKQILTENKFSKISGSELPEKTIKDILLIDAFDELFPPVSPIHGAVYLGKAGGVPTVFEQQGTGQPFRIRPILEELRTPAYFMRE